MPEWVTIAQAMLTGAVALCALVLHARNIKKTSPVEEVKKRQDEADAKFDNDNRRLNHLERGEEKREEFERLALHCFKGLLEHFSEGNHTEAMKRLANDVDKYLIDR